MRCNNCGFDNVSEAEFCGNCGQKIEKYVVEEIQNKSINKINSFTSNMKNNIIKHKKIIMIGFGVICIFIIGLFLWNQVKDVISFGWDKSYQDYHLKYVTKATIKLGITIEEKESEKITYQSSCGEVTKNGLEIMWDLKETTGKCKITAQYKLKKISKEYTVISADNQEQELVLDDKIDLDSDEDLDLDGFTNKQEKEYGTNPLLSDSDMDGLDDYYEIFTSKTDPNKKDTDGDGLSDYDEIELGLDPLKTDSKQDGIQDGNRTLQYQYENENIKMEILGKGNIASTTAQVHSGTKISTKKGLLDYLYTFYTDGTLEKAIVTIPYKEEELKKLEFNENNLSIYYYDEQTGNYEKIETTIDTKNKTLTAILTHFSNYVVGDTSLVKEHAISQVLFVLDNSWSMYSAEQYEQFTGKKYTGTTPLEGFDKEGVRFTLTSNLVTTLSEKGHQIGLSEFRYDYKNALKIGSDADKIKSKLNTMNGKFITFTEGTNIANALSGGIREFDKDSDYKYIILLTDGQDSSLSFRAMSIISEATKNNVKICSVGFGGGAYNTELENISSKTGCNFYSSSNANGLVELFGTVASELNDDLVDVDTDNEVDGILIADSGFVVNRDGFSFKNYGTNLSKGGHCYGMATVAELYYKKVLPLNVGSISVGKSKSYAYDLSNTYFKNYRNLYDYNLKTDALKYVFGFDKFGQENPTDLRILKDKVLLFNDTYKNEIINSGIYDVSIEKSGLSKEKQLEKYGVNYKKAEVIYLNEDLMQNSKIVKNDDLQILNAIYAGFIRQDATTHYASSSDFTLWLRNVFKTESSEKIDRAGFIELLKQRLENGDVPVISSSYNNGLHAINAISLVQDIKNPNYYYIGVYDNNYPGEKRYVDIECTKKVCVTKANRYYSNSKQPIRITPSLEYDLNYYQK